MTVDERPQEREITLLMRAIEALLLAVHDERAVLATATNLLGEQFGYGSRAILLYQRAADELVMGQAAGPGSDDPALIGWRRRLGEGLSGIAAKTRSVVNVGDLFRDPRTVRVGQGQLSRLCVPMLVRDELLGVVVVESPKRDAFRLRDEELLGAFARVLALALMSARAFHEAQVLAITDSLTGLYNARYFTGRLEAEVQRAERYGHELALLIVDSDALKRVNDHLGHVAGNELLASLSRSIKQHVRATDLVARFGGDEFVILQPETGLDAALATAERIREAAYAASDAAGIERSVSVGVAAYPAAATTADALFQRADDALYRAKRAGKNKVVAAR